MSRSFAGSPWQVVLASAAIIVLAVDYLMFALLHVAQYGDRTGVDAYLSEYQAIPSMGIGSSAELHEWLGLSATVFGVVAAVLFLLGILLWQGVARPGVRITATITTVISLIGAFIPLSSGLGATNAVVVEALLVTILVNLAAVIACLFLWMPAVRGWINEPAPIRNTWEMS